MEFGLSRYKRQQKLLIKLLRSLDSIFFKEYSRKHLKVQILSKEGSIATVKALDFIWKLDTTRYIDEYILKNGIFEPESTALIQKLVEPSMIVLDVGANFGYYTLQFARLVGENGYVYAFEPVDRYRARLGEHLRLNNIRNVEVINKALSNKIATAKISVGECSATFHWCSPGEAEEVQEVHLTTFDAFVEEHKIQKIDFLKVDLDGHELMFFEGAKNTLRKVKPIMLVEFCQEFLYASGTAAWDLADKLENLGYVLISTKSRRAFQNRQECFKEVANFSHSVNVLCIPSASELLDVFKGGVL